MQNVTDGKKIPHLNRMSLYVQVFFTQFGCNVLVYYMQHKACITFSFHIQYQMRDGHKSRDYS